MRSLILACACAAVFFGLCPAASAQICRPVTERARNGDVGCWIVAHASLDELTQPQVFWYLDVYPTRAAAEAARGPRGAVVESYGKVWLFTVEGKDWRPSGGQRINEIGPLPVIEHRKYMAQYMEATFDPGMTATSHEHPGPEAWHTRLLAKPVWKLPRGSLSAALAGHPSSFPADPQCT